MANHEFKSHNNERTLMFEKKRICHIFVPLQEKSIKRYILFFLLTRAEVTQLGPWLARTDKSGTKRKRVFVVRQCRIDTENSSCQVLDLQVIENLLEQILVC